MRAYMAYCRLCGSQEGAALVFAHSVKEAKRIAWPVIHSWGLTDEYIDLAVRWLNGDDYLFEDADQEKLANGVAHVIESPTACRHCERWGRELNHDGVCEQCFDEIDPEGVDGWMKRPFPRR